MTLQTLYALIYDKTLLERLPPSIFYHKIKTNTSVRNSSFSVLFDGPKTQIRPIQRSIFPLLKHSLSRHTHIHTKKRKKPNVRTMFGYMVLRQPGPSLETCQWHIKFIGISHLILYVIFAENRIYAKTNNFDSHTIAHRSINIMYAHLQKESIE